ncbi:Homeobox protein Hox-D1, partial [Clarias magur]
CAMNWVWLLLQTSCLNTHSFFFSCLHSDEEQQKALFCRNKKTRERKRERK